MPALIGLLRFVNPQLAIALGVVAALLIGFTTTAAVYYGKGWDAHVARVAELERQRNIDIAALNAKLLQERLAHLREIDEVARGVEAEMRSYCLTQPVACGAPAPTDPPAQPGEAAAPRPAPPATAYAVPGSVLTRLNKIRDRAR